MLRRAIPRSRLWRWPLVDEEDLRIFVTQETVGDPAGRDKDGLCTPRLVGPDDRRIMTDVALIGSPPERGCEPCVVAVE